jgi:alpha-galactosidase
MPWLGLMVWYVFCFHLTATVTDANTQGRLPALGWNTWNAFACDIDASKVLTAAKETINLGLKDAGYEYINSKSALPICAYTLTAIVDDCWSVKSGRDPSTNRMIPDPTKFPDGISGIASQIHDLGLKVGIYSSEYPH